MHAAKVPVTALHLPRRNSAGEKQKDATKTGIESAHAAGWGVTILHFIGEETEAQGRRLSEGHSSRMPDLRFKLLCASPPVLSSVLRDQAR